MAQSLTELNVISRQILACAYQVHTALGPGLLESAYKECLAYALTKSGLFVEKEKAMPLVYKEIRLEVGYRIDLLVNQQIVLELKSVEALTEVHLAQILTYMRLGNYKLGLLLNFNVASLKNGIRRVVL
ncbi:GxxExxY protein [Siphonobacter sp. BAB-5385]|uniref:GxxExxY protein n=1 Tax=Siphonobacter sp. BAB-5385 TaxID=1864822 RepID=UPI000B9E8AE1|nr:GxxExxY protein [Siphonobacter sp. BAB-5385]OZI06120.1 GxxExxY protein [Siphonobacter sp. BAB-5385]